MTAEQSARLMAVQRVYLKVDWKDAWRAVLKETKLAGLRVDQWVERLVAVSVASKAVNLV